MCVLSSKTTERERGASVAQSWADSYRLTLICIKQRPVKIMHDLALKSNNCSDYLSSNYSPNATLMHLVTGFSSP